MDAAADLPGRSWKPVYWVVAMPVSAVGAIGYLSIPSQLFPPSWQALQLVVTPACTCAVEGTGVANRVPGGEAVAFDATAVDGMEAWWQVSHAVPVGT